MKKAVPLFGLLLFLLTFKMNGQQLTPERRAEIRREVEILGQSEQQAFKQGECEKVVSFFDEEVTFFANGRQAPSIGFIQDFCTRIKRPFERGNVVSDKIYVVSEGAAHNVKVIEFKPGKDQTDTFRREVVTKVWAKQPDGWKIVHFHSSVSAVPKM